MRTALGSTQNPMDYNLQAVLPGVHSRLATHEDATRQLVQQVSQMPRTMEDVFRRMIVSFAGSLTSSFGTNQQPPSLPTNTNTTNDSAINHLLTSTHNNVRSIYNEWFGLGDFDGVPIPGGIAECEKKFGRKWRKTNSANRISRQSRVCRALQKEVDEGKALDDVCHEWDEIYIKDCRKNLSQFVIKLQEKGAIPKKGNRRSRSD